MSWRNIGVALAMLVVLGVGAWKAAGFARGLNLSQGYQPPQPIAFSHQLHAGEREIPCLYCHYGAERSRHAGIPALSVCMGCHREIDKPSLELARLTDAVERRRPIRWIQVHKLPDFVYFSHRRHVGAGVECRDCHGAVETMEVVRQEAPLSMGWCLACHQQRGVTEFAARGEAVARATEDSEDSEDSAHSPNRPGGTLRDGPSPATGGMDCAKCHY